MGIFDLIFGSKRKRIKEFLENDAIIVDVRTQEEWDQGHISNAKHVPLANLKDAVPELRALNKPIIICCRSGARSVTATEYLHMQNIDATNGGGWKSLEKIINA